MVSSTLKMRNTAAAMSDRRAGEAFLIVDDEGKVFRIFANGEVEGFGANPFVVNYSRLAWNASSASHAVASAARAPSPSREGGSHSTGLRRTSSSLSIAAADGEKKTS